MLGTLITEGDVGLQENCTLLDTPVDVLVPRLVELAAYYGFDGWFFNIGEYVFCLIFHGTIIERKLLEAVNVREV